MNVSKSIFKLACDVLSAEEGLPDEDLCWQLLDALASAGHRVTECNEESNLVDIMDEALAAASECFDGDRRAADRRDHSFWAAADRWCAIED